jgi:hypothetical protein
MERSACAFLLLIASCASTGSGRSDAAADGGGDGPPSATTPIRGTGGCSDVEIAYFVAVPSTIDGGATSTLSWDGRMARGCDLEPGSIGFGGGPLSWTVTPSRTTEYSLRCFGTACLDSAEAPVARVTVTVR